ncbi:EamA family transporter [Leptospira sarikeiensis]|uniref:EamA family transporter n=1 Tax=Leptospira sarikeiensis TaxID=2484943 RepID=A0A4R9K785_9LEPT|nr:EamA family transporter [Leptospira sarikeiensis]TGL61482.1 EamA family transporter [Leptospira sarikeiensis]
MEKWVLYAILSMLAAGVTAILAKVGIQDVSAETGLLVRTTVIFSLLMGLGIYGNYFRELPSISISQWWFLIISGITTCISWYFYYKAMKEGLVSYVSAIDKASIIVTLILSFWILKEPITLQILIGTGLIGAGLFVLVWK